MNFCFATSVVTAFVFSTVLAFAIKSTQSFESDGLQPQLIILTALAAIFWLFTFSLFVANANLIMHGQTTVESMHIRGIKEREDRVLARGFGWWEFRQAIFYIFSVCFLFLTVVAPSAKKKRRKFFDREWGALNTEGNIWWRGNAYDEWVDVMGKNWLGWICEFSPLNFFF
jgi:palmitoyltransferase